MTTDGGRKQEIPWMSERLQKATWKAFNACLAECKGPEIATIEAAAYGLLPGDAPKSYHVACNKLLAWFNGTKTLYQKRGDCQSADRVIRIAYFFRTECFDTVSDLLKEPKRPVINEDWQTKRMIKQARIAMTPSEYPHLDWTCIHFWKSACPDLK